MRFTIEQIRKYLNSQDSFGDALYNLSEDNILKACENIYICRDSFKIDAGEWFDRDEEVTEEIYNSLTEDDKTYFTKK
jgi:hypothetical protein